MPKQELIESLNPGERDLYAEMIMRSLRGSWNQPRERAQILRTISNVGGLLVYDEDDLRKKVDAYLNRGSKKGFWDGRWFRGYYGEVNPSDFDESTVRELASHIPNDLTWDDYRINSVFGNE